MNSEKIFRLSLLTLFLLLLTPFIIFPQIPKSYNAAEIKLALKKLNMLGIVLYIGAHPDDENTEFLTYCSFGRLLRTGYLSLTRGDGGQNLIGNEQADLLGVIRTQELLQARRLEGSEQFFTRAVDFGFTKSPDETFKFWNKEKILSDVVWVIRKFKPDVIVTRFPMTGEGRHGHHTASAILALEAFNIAGDSTVFPDQLEYIDVWSPKRIYWNGWTPALKQMGISPDTLISLNFGAFNPLLGKSYTEIAAVTRSMHKSQGFGDSGWRADYFNYFIPLAEQQNVNDMFEGIDITWNRINGENEIKNLIDTAINNFDYEDPSRTVPLLLEAYKKVSELNDNYWSQLKSKEILNLIKACAGLWIEATVKESIFSPGSNFTVTTGIVNRSSLPIVLEGVFINYQITDSLLIEELKKGEFISVEKEIHLPDNIDITQPYWLKEQHSSATYNISDQSLIGLAEIAPPLVANFRLSIDDTKLVLCTPVQYRENDPVKGEVYNPIVISPPVTANFEHNLYLFDSNNKREVRITLKNFKDKSSGNLKLKAPRDWHIDPASIDFELNGLNGENQFIFNITPSITESEGDVIAEIKIEDDVYSKSLVTINYDHIPTQTVFPDAVSKLVKIDMGERVVNKIGYLMGSGDDIPNYLRELGFSVDLLTDIHLSNGDLSKYDVIIAGIRAYNTNERMEIYQNKILEYVEAGGTYIAQYNTLGKRFAEPGPYELKISRDRVTEEDSKVEFVNPEHPLLNFPNKITEKDFDGWIQERGLYFPDEWDDKYQVLLKMNDTDESPKLGALLYTKYGKGIFIYTGLSFFRELPAGVPGAYRLFINLISAGKYGK